jgi:hypoxanthine phosphoribosyltransferase
MIFYNKLYDQQNSILYLIDYEKKYLKLQIGEKNFEQGETSAKINGLNSANEALSIKNANIFSNIFDPILHKDILICSVPSHDPLNTNTGINKLISNLCNKNSRLNGSGVLYRNTKIDKIALGGISTKEIHNKTISVNKPESIEGKEILLLDDIALTCNSIYACKEKLLNLGAKNVASLVLGYVRKCESKAPPKKDLDTLLKNRRSPSNAGAELYNQYYNNKKNYPAQAAAICNAIYYEIYNAKNPNLINSGEIVNQIAQKHYNNVCLLTQKKALPENYTNSFLGVLIYHLMLQLGYAQVKKIDERYSLYTPLLHAVT